MYKYLFTFLLSTFLFVGCDNFLDVVPRDKQTEEQLYTTKGGFYMAANGIYEGLASTDLYGRVLSFETLDIMAKRYAIVRSNLYYADLVQYNYPSLLVSPVLSTAWQKSYALILAANILIENIQKQQSVLTQNEADILHGEMLALRAYLHFDMLRLFGPRWNDNPSELTIPYNESAQVQTLPLLDFSTVSDKILNDLDHAQSLLGADPVITNGPMASFSESESVHLRYRQFRLNFYAVKALKARVLLYCGKQNQALETAKSILEDQTVQRHFPQVDPSKLLANFNNPDRVFSSEVFSSIYLRNRDQIFTQYFSSETASQNLLQPHNQYISFLFSQFFGMLGAAGELQDYRFQSQWEQPTAVGATGYTFSKFKAINRPNQIDETSEYFYAKMLPLLRLSEVYYIAAECETNPTEKFKWINIMRQRRGLTVFPASAFSMMSDPQYFNLILANEYMREFNGEGQIFYFIKRKAYNLVYENGYEFNYGNYTDQAYRPPLPVGEMK
jgi:SusD family.